MKINQFIAKGLALGIILNSISITSYANTEIPNRYQTLEGEFIMIDDSVEGNLEDIEILGDTWQDSDSKNLFNEKEFNNPLDGIWSDGLYKSREIQLKPNTQYTISFNRKREAPNTYTILKINDKDICYVTPDLSLNIFWSTHTFITDETGTIRITCFVEDIKYWFTDFLNVQIEEGSVATSYVPYHKADLSNIQHLGELYVNESGEPVLDNKGREQYKYEIRSSNSPDSTIEGYQSSTQTILLPTQLMRVGDVRDRLYWDNNKNRYIIEKNIVEHRFIGGEGWRRDMIFPTYATYKINSSIFQKKPILGNIYPSITTKSVGVTKRELAKMYSTPTSCVGDTENYAFFFNLSHNEIGYDNLDGENFNDKLVDKWVKENTPIAYYATSNPDIIETNITSKLKIPTYSDRTYIYINSKNGINPTLKVTVDRLPQIAKEAVIQAERDNTTHNIALARRYINMLPESSYKDQLQNQLSDIFSSDMVLDMKTTTSNLDIYIKSENILQMSLDTNSISFEDFSGIEDVVEENAVNITINSSLPYQINAYLPAEIQNADKTKTLDKSILNIKENSESNYQTFANTTDKIVLKDNCSAGNQLTHGVDLKLAGGIAHEKDVYKATIKLEAEQK